MQSTGVDIKKKGQSQVTPTPNNTPLAMNQFPSSSKPSLSTMPEEGDDNDANANLPDIGLLNMLEGRLGSLVGKKSGYIKSLPESVQARINGLKGLQHKTHQLETQFHSEFFELEKKYAQLFNPLFEERSSIVNGLKEPEATDADLGKQIREEEEENENGDESVTKSNEKVDGIPEFWLTIFKNHPSIVDLISDKDEEALKHLADVSIRYLTDEPGYCLDFIFTSNPFFTNSVLTKKYFFSQTEKTGEFIIERAEGTEIDWKEGKDLTKEIHIKKQIHKVTQETRIITKESAVDSFFKFFESIDENAEINEEDPLQNPELDYQLGETLRESLIPHAVDWFTGAALEYDAPFPDQFGNEYENFEDEDEDELEDFDEED